MNRWSTVAALTAAVLLSGGTASATPLSSAVSKPATVVSLTFDDGFKTQVEAARELAKRGMSGTFYVNSGSLKFPGYMTPDEVKEVSRLGNEIGGHSVNHAHLADIAPAEAKSEICSDRGALSSLVGSPLTSFAYPYGDVDNSVIRLTKACGYNSGRGVSGLRVGPSNCSDCPPAETIPPQNPYTVRTIQSVQVDDTFEDLTKSVTAAELKGGWLPLTFHRMCDACAEESTSMQTFVRFLDWLGTRPSTTTVRTVGQVIGGPAKPVTAGATGKSSGAVAPVNPGPSSSSATFHILGYGVGQAQIVGVGVGLGVVLALVYRGISRKRRYRGGSA